MALPIKNFSGYSDLDLSFNKHPIRKDLMTTTGEFAVVRALKNLLLTNYYEKPFNMNYGSNIRKLLFEPLTPLTASAITKEVEFAIKNFEPRVNLDKVSVDALYDHNAYQVTIEFYIENLVEPFTADFILSRLR
jgi:phage baseplate assembly protein W